MWTHLVAVVALSLLCGGWVGLQLLRRDAGCDRQGGCDGGAGGCGCGKWRT